MAALPTGDVTFCFTDIEGSTRLARRQPKDWPALLDRHHRVLREVWQRWRGVEVKTEGDAFFVAFGDPTDAVAAVLDGQRVLAAEPWPIAVRMGLHTGAAEVIDDDYVGAEVHRAARVAAAAHGGQVLLSGRTAELVAGSLPDGASLRDLGRFALKDFEDGERLVRLDHPDLRDDTPAPRAMPLAAHNLPELRTTFVGRDVERIEVAKLVSEHRLVTIVAPGGAGKTRLALEIGRLLAPDFAEEGDGVWAVLLAGLPPGGDVAGTVARTLGVADVPGLATVDAVAGALAESRRLLVLDNVEHVVDEVVALVDRLLERGPDLRILVTTRQPLRVRGEVVWHLPQLDGPRPGATSVDDVLETDAGRLFVERASAADAAFELTDANAAAVATICRGVDGLPLALELAAATARSIPLATLAARIGDASRLLRSGNREDAPRQQTVDDLIGWSYDLLDERQRSVFRRLSVFRGGCTVEAAEAVLGEDVLLDLAELAERSLLLPDAEDRYRMLVLIRGFADARLTASGEAEATRAAHAAWTTGLARELAAEGVTAASLRRAERELENLVTGFRWAIDAGDGARANAILIDGFGPLLLHRGHYAEIDGHFTALAAILAEDDPALPRILVNRAQLANVFGRTDDARRNLARAVELATNAEAPETVAAALGLLARIDVERSDPAAAIATIDRALELPVSALRRATLLEERGMALRVVGDADAALAATLAAGDLYEAERDHLRAAQVRLGAVEHLAETGRSSESAAIVAAALRLADEIDVPRLRAHALYVRARLARRGFLAGRPLEDLDEAVAAATSLGELRAHGAYRLERAIARWSSGEARDAAADLEVALPLVRAVPDCHDDAVAIGALVVGELDGDSTVVATLLACASASAGAAEQPRDELFEEVVRRAANLDRSGPILDVVAGVDLAITAVADLRR
jgi:predicted ATPase/class 3 adenylate cyclase